MWKDVKQKIVRHVSQLEGKMSLELSLTEWFGPILCGKVQKLWPIIKLLRQEGITKLQKGKKKAKCL